MSINTVFELIKIQPQSESAFELAACLGFEQRHVELPELRGSEALVGLQNIVAAFEPRRAGEAFLESSGFAFDHSGALEDAFFDALAEGCVCGEEPLLGARNHSPILAAALAATAVVAVLLVFPCLAPGLDAQKPSKWLLATP